MSEQKTLKETELLFSKNIKFFKEHIPSIYTEIEKFEGKLKLNLCPKTGILFKDDNGKSIYNESPVQYAKDEVSEFIEKSESLDYRPIPSKLMVNHLIIKHPFNETVKKYAEYYKDGTSKQPHIVDILVFGVGFGLHIDELIKRVKFRNITIIENTFSNFMESLYILNWQKTLDSMEKSSGIKLIFKAQSMTEQTYKETIQRNISSNFPIDVFSTKIYNHLSSSNYTKEKGWIKDLLNFNSVAYEKLGPDSQRLININENIRKRIPLINIKKSKKNNGSPVCIIGAGPSLDTFLPHIIKYRNQYTIVSCGSSLTTLLKSKITPDYHFELEFQNLAAELIKENNKIKSTKDIELLGSIEINPKIPEYFSSFKAYIPETSDLNLHFGSQYVVGKGGITCTNGATALISEIFDGDIYLFGTDFAHLDGKHHSKDNITNQTGLKGELKHLEDKGNQLNTSATLETIDIHGNKIYTSPGLNSAKIMMEALIRKSNNSFFNCSSGAKIEGTNTLDINKLNEISKARKTKAKRFNITCEKQNYQETKKRTLSYIDSSINTCEQIYNIINRNKDREPEYICHIIIDIIQNILKQTGMHYGIRKNTMSFIRLPIYNLFGIAMYINKNHSEEIFNTWLNDFKNYYESSYKIIKDILSNETNLLETDWIDRI
jgi:hypothetical protein